MIGAKLGHLVSEETRNKISEWNKNAYKLGLKEKFWKGKTFTEEHKNKLSESHKGFTIKNHFTGKGLRGRKHTEEHIRKFKLSNIGKHCGDRNGSWKGGITPMNVKIRTSIESKLWRNSVFARDNWTCQKCGTRGVNLCSHHIYNFSQYPELRFAIDNGITLCKECHKKFHRKYGIKNNNQEQIIKFK
jgi:hypothetical protein